MSSNSLEEYSDFMFNAGSLNRIETCFAVKKVSNRNGLSSKDNIVGNLILYVSNKFLRYKLPFKVLLK